VLPIDGVPRRRPGLLDELVSLYGHLRSLESCHYLQAYPSTLTRLAITRNVRERIMDPTSPPPRMTRPLPALPRLRSLCLSVTGSHGGELVRRLARCTMDDVELHCPDLVFRCAPTLTRLVLHCQASPILTLATRLASLSIETHESVRLDVWWNTCVGGARLSTLTYLSLPRRVDPCGASGMLGRLAGLRVLAVHCLSARLAKAVVSAHLPHLEIVSARTVSPSVYCALTSHALFRVRVGAIEEEPTRLLRRNALGPGELERTSGEVEA
jgi:hypothetical protein